MLRKLPFDCQELYSVDVWISFERMQSENDEQGAVLQTLQMNKICV